MKHPRLVITLLTIASLISACVAPTTQTVSAPSETPTTAAPTPTPVTTPLVYPTATWNQRLTANDCSGCGRHFEQQGTVRLRINPPVPRSGELVTIIGSALPPGQYRVGIGDTAQNPGRIIAESTIVQADGALVTRFTMFPDWTAGTCLIVWALMTPPATWVAPPFAVPAP